jgi:hypothetical protein
MNKLDQFLLKRIVKKQLQGGDQRRKISNLYNIIKEVIVKEYPEDNIYSLESYLLERFQDALAYDVTSLLENKETFNQDNN